MRKINFLSKEAKLEFFNVSCLTALRGYTKLSRTCMKEILTIFSVWNTKKYSCNSRSPETAFSEMLGGKEDFSRSPQLICMKFGTLSLILKARSWTKKCQFIIIFLKIYNILNTKIAFFVRRRSLNEKLIFLKILRSSTKKYAYRNQNFLAVLSQIILL